MPLPQTFMKEGNKENETNKTGFKKKNYERRIGIVFL